MNTYDIVWHDYGSVIARNSVVADPRPTEIQAHSFSTLYSGNNICAVAFYGPDEGEPLIILYELPLFIKRRNA